MSKYHTDCYGAMKQITNIFPIEVELPACFLNGQGVNDEDDEDEVDDESPDGDDVNDYHSDQQQKNANVKTENLIGTF
jgi:hypothetical protein